LAQEELPRLIRGDANEVLPAVLDDLPHGMPAIIMTTWAFAYFSLEQRDRFVEILDLASRTRPVAWLSAEAPGVVEALAVDQVPSHDGTGADLLGAIVFDGGVRTATLLAFTQAHGNWIDWRAG
jgi:hypothetical protein